MYKINFSDDAKEDFRYFKKAKQKIILDEVEKHLLYQPSVETRKRRKLRENPLSTFEFKINEIRVLYDVLEQVQTVDIVAIGWKKHNDLYIRGDLIKL